MIEKKIYRMAHIYITAFHVDFVRRECCLRRECRHSVELRQCAGRCATEIKVGHLKTVKKQMTKFMSANLKKKKKRSKVYHTDSLRLKGKHVDTNEAAHFCHLIWLNAGYKFKC